MQKQILGQKAARYASFFFPTIFLLASIGQHTSIISERNPSVTYLQREFWLFNRTCLRKTDRRKQKLFSLFLKRLKKEQSFSRNNNPIEHCIDRENTSDYVMIRKRKSLVCGILLTSLTGCTASLVPILAPKANGSLFPTGSFFSVYPNEYTSSDWLVEKIGLEKAWEISTGHPEVKVGIVDTGIDASLVELNGRVNTSLSYDFVSENSQSALTYILPHGTCVASVLGAVANNSSAFSGICWDIDLVSYRIDDHTLTSEHGVVDALIDAIEQAEEDGVPILCYADGYYYGEISSTKVSELQNAILGYSGLIVCAAGNEAIDLDDGITAHTLYPQSFNCPNLLVVGASSNLDGRPSYSNYGQDSVDVFAPGNYLRVPSYPLYENGVCVGYSTSFSGTSAAAPVVAGVAALMKAVNPSLTTSQIKNKIIQTVATGFWAFDNECASGGRIDAYSALLSALPTYSLAPQTIYCPRPILVGGHQWYKLLPTNDSFTISSSGSLDVDAALYSDPMESPLITANSGGSGSNFSFQYNFDSNSPYYLKVSNSSSAAGSYSINIVAPHYHDYSHSYTWINGKKHRAFCSCGAIKLQGHIVAPGATLPSTCLLCGGMATVAFVGGPLSTGIPIYDDLEADFDTIFLTQAEMDEYLSGHIELQSVYNSRGNL